MGSRTQENSFFRDRKRDSAPFVIGKVNKDRYRRVRRRMGRGWMATNLLTEDKMVGWHHRLNGHEFEQTSGGGEGQGRLVCCHSWDCKESDMTG